MLNVDRTSDGMFFERGENELVARLEQRIATLLNWPVENGEGLQILRYAPGAEYKPHYDYFDPGEPGTPTILKRGGQRVATLVMYLQRAREGRRHRRFPDVDLEVAPRARQRACSSATTGPHPSTQSLHGGAPVIAGEKWIATKWLREREFSRSVKVHANGIADRSRRHRPGATARPVVLLIMGLGMQLMAWPTAFVQRAGRRGLSRGALRQPRHRPDASSFDHAGAPQRRVAERSQHRLGLAVRAPYTLHDMAADALGVLDALGIAKAHVVGASHGRHDRAAHCRLHAATRVPASSSIMSSSGARGLPGPRREVTSHAHAPPVGPRRGRAGRRTASGCCG